MSQIHLRCRCGTVQGLAECISPQTGTRVVCYCDDCQTFARHLGQQDTVLDQFGGTDIFQITPAQISLHSGSEQLCCLRLSPKGLHRWYTGCCNTPVGNTLAAGVPFVGMIRAFMQDDGGLDQLIGPVRGYLQTKYAYGKVPQQQRSQGFPVRVVLRSASKILSNKLRGRRKPSPFFDDDGRPISPPIIIDSPSPSE